MRRAALSTLFLAFGFTGLWAASDPRTAGNSLLETADARVTGLSGAATALTGDLGVAAVNPAALPTLVGAEASTQFESAPGDVRTGMASFGRGNGRAGWAATGLFFDAGKIDVVPLSGPGYTRRAQQDWVGALTGGIALGESLRLGVAGKALSSTLVRDYHAAVFAGDAGFQWDVSRNLTLGGAVTNAGPKLTYRNQGDPLPTEYRAGAAVKFALGSGGDESEDPDSPWYTKIRSDKNYITVTGDAVADRFGAVAGAVGLEWDYARRAILRGGMRLGQTGDSFSAGLGFWMKGGRFDYSFQAVGDLPDRHRVTVSWFWKKKSEE